ncbi:DNA-binding response regulator [Carnobacterium maltaromaticum]|uniref:LytR/AlgR family response regulator transcription factor n=1 Tax=Carnobacterium maltaromaticum TaxID=2751 RepID=UPI000C7691EE|nr:LytTR family DNA-binding domain-containing protein [Carnobacterium maltaromaticum]PLS32673.1 DNA-binding response regulator [Carnobacterium maltaromaticum]PLS33173.1 DNA-binding response regulator [Carnobacterium maltaromaticum]PLS33259.1 DNA-binding response regulator [Carnobacterium maltaromaticum]PLS40979.1 DNA-binding response regulator [Carnobacterium maltaromaticum]PLS41739.1 DNA-binding response regulator [Carnobacterium maltaromaticum]
MKIAIVEDNEANFLTLKQHIDSFFKAHNLIGIIDYYPDGLALVNSFKNNYDIIYLDVEMELMDGMTAAKKIRQIDEEVLIVFVTNYVQWAIEGYTVNATDFLLKPLSYFNFSEHFKKIQKRLNHNEQKYLTIKAGSGFTKIKLSELFFIESEGHYLKIHTHEQTFTLLESMKNMEKKLLEEDFFRCNNCYLVNLKYVTGIEKNTAKVGHYNLQISRPRKKEFLEALTAYIGGD